jgi:hypothetical protein
MERIIKDITHTKLQMYLTFKLNTGELRYVPLNFKKEGEYMRNTLGDLNNHLFMQLEKGSMMKI